VGMATNIPSHNLGEVIDATLAAAGGNTFYMSSHIVASDNIAVSKSTDGGKTYALQDLLAETFTDRQWSEGDEANVVYLVGNPTPIAGTVGTSPGNASFGNTSHTLYKTKDGGKNCTAGLNDSGGLGDLRVDKSDGTLYEAHYDGETLSMAAFRNARKDDLKPEINPIAKGVDMKSHWPSFDLDRLGNLYITWDETGRGNSKRAAGIYYAYSRDRGKTWSQPARVDTDAKTSIWPWLAVGEPGKVAIAWLDADLALTGDNPELSGTYGWNVYVAQTLEGLGCTRSSVPAFTVVKGTTAAIHQGTVCMSGTTCEASQTDRRLGDYFAIAIDGNGAVDAVYSDTQKGGVTGLAGYLHQSGGSLFGPPAIVSGFGSAGPASTGTQTAVQGATQTRAAGPRLPATGGNSRLALLALAIVLTGGGLWAVIRRRPAPVKAERRPPNSYR